MMIGQLTGIYYYMLGTFLSSLQAQMKKEGVN